MRILITNDDGIEAPGIAALVQRLGTDHELFVLAPDRERSGVGHAFTLAKAIHCAARDDLFEPGLVRAAWSCSGTPVDCVKLALLRFLRDDPPELVLSGINRGANLSVDHLYSGTVAAALEAAIKGFRAIAVSVEIRPGAGEPRFDTAAGFICDFLAGTEWSDCLGHGCMLNVNVPGLPYSELAGRRFTCVGRCSYDDGYEELGLKDGTTGFRLRGTMIVEDGRDWADIVALRAGFVSITPLGPDLTDFECLRRFGVPAGESNDQ